MMTTSVTTMHFFIEIISSKVIKSTLKDHIVLNAQKLSSRFMKIKGPDQTVHSPNLICTFGFAYLKVSYLNW